MCTQFPEDEDDHKYHAQYQKRNDIARFPPLWSVAGKATDSQQLSQNAHSEVYTRLKAAENRPVPAIAKKLPIKSKFLHVSLVNFSLGVESFGSTQMATSVSTKNTMANHQKPALQSKIWQTIPPEIKPNTKPRGFPALKQAKAAFFLCEGRSYITPSIPCAGGTDAADMSPMSPESTSNVTPVLAKPAPNAITAKRNKLEMNMVRRPKRSARRANSSRNDPDASDEAAESHVNSAVDILSDRPIKDDVTVTVPASIELIPRALVAVRTTRISWRVEVNTAGLALGLSFNGFGMGRGVGGMDSTGLLGSIGVVGSISLLFLLSNPILNPWFLSVSLLH
jgi:hypothetical protein